MVPLLSIQDLHVSVEGKEILHGVSLQVAEGELHAIMGPNGSGKSTLANTLAGHPKFEVTGGSATFKEKDLLSLKPDERAKLGLFLAFQYPREIAGVTLRSFLFAAYNAQRQAREKNYKKLSPLKFKKILEDAMRELKVDPSFAERSVNQGFSGGEKKKAEILQLKVLKPLLALLDETDSGLDIDALKTVAEGINSMRTTRHPERAESREAGRSESKGDIDALKIVADGVNAMRSPKFSAILVTHYARILSYITPDRVHVMVDGKIVESGGAEIALTLEKHGYAQYGIDEKGGKALPTISLER